MSARQYFKKGEENFDKGHYKEALQNVTVAIELTNEKSKYLFQYLTFKVFCFRI